MKTKLLLLVMTALSITSCNDAFNRDKCLNSVKKAYPNCEVYFAIQRNEYDFIIKDTYGNLILVGCQSNFSTGISDVDTLIRAK